jgi:protein-disulfide isomerase
MLCGAGSAALVWTLAWTLGRFVFPVTIQRAVLLQPVVEPLDLPAPLYEGAAHAAVTLVEVADFECSHCAAFQRTLDELKQHYGDALRVGFVPYARGRVPHKYLYGAAVLAAGDQGKAAAMKVALFDADLSPRATGGDRLGYARRVVREAALSLSLDMSRFEETLESSQAEERLRELGRTARENGLRATPTIFVNGFRVHAPPDAAVCRAVIESCLAGECAAAAVSENAKRG